MTTEPATDWSQCENIPPPKPNTLAFFPANDTERAERLVKLFADELRYMHAWKRWLLWDGNRWTPDVDGAVYRKAQELSPILLREALDIIDADKRKKAVGEAIRAGDKAKIEASVTLAQNHLGASPTLFDSDAMLLGVSNGVVNLRTGEHRPARREDFIIKCVKADYDCNAACDTWEQFLQRVFDGDTELISFIQRAIGYSLTSLTSEQCLFFLFGTGQNGKSTFTKLLEGLLGTYALKSVSSLYTLAANGRQPLEEIARLVGRRFVTGSETEEGDDLAESRVKDITGGDTMTGRELYCQAFNTEPSHKLWIYGNHRPNVRGNDHGIWRRIKLIPFRVQIPDAEKDPDLPNKLWAERCGILNWAIKGCLEWREHGLGESRAVIEATADYREDEDELGEFIVGMCWEEGEVERSTLYEAYRIWAENRGNRYVPKQTTFSKRIGERAGIKGRKSGKKRYWTGISLRLPEGYEGRRGIRVNPAERNATLVPCASENARFGHLGQENGPFPKTFSRKQTLEKFGEIR